MNLTGVFAPVPTPFDDRDQLDLVRLRAAFRHWLASPLAGFVVLGSTGEAGLLDDDESDRVVSEARAILPAGRLLIAGTGRESTKAAVAASRRAAASGVDAVLVRTPSFFRAQMNDSAFLRHYTAVADASTVPVLLYNFPAATGVNMLPSTVARLAEHPNIVGVKESSSDMVQIAELISLTPPGFHVLAGSGSTFCAALCTGVTGGILALATLFPEACVRMFNLAREGRYEEARALQRDLAPVAKLIASGYGVPGLKAALKIAGCDVGPPRRPLGMVSDTALSEIQDALKRFGEVRV